MTPDYFIHICLFKCRVAPQHAKCIIKHSFTWGDFSRGTSLGRCYVTMHFSSAPNFFSLLTMYMILAIVQANEHPKKKKSLCSLESIKLSVLDISLMRDGLQKDEGKDKCLTSWRNIGTSPEVAQRLIIHCFDLANWSWTENCLQWAHYWLRN